jgi:hypothetical protein
MISQKKFLAAHFADGPDRYIEILQTDEVTKQTGIKESQIDFTQTDS